ncbi:hypothetical protein Asi02nite_69550 [Asanoa siamensis]|uniref:Uncharacterized protein n=2 Tax=Asanoa siamensis TaxID=926357 RepID=A0ABQ4D2T5_9ACTN|nr:hypothetical protein Asi02nite_69550 [Asanoa siamensis]
MLAGFETGWVESHMNNLNCGDSDSLGVFQQRPSQGWGTPQQIMNVTYAANKFFDVGEVEDRNCASCTAGQIAQRVQRSAHPERYDAAEAKARALLAEARRGGFDDIGVYRPAEARFYLKGGEIVHLGNPHYEPLMGDWNGDGVDTPGVFRRDQRTFFLKNTNTSGDADGAYALGNSTDIPVAGDWDGNGTTGIGVFRPSTGTFYLKNRFEHSGNAEITAVFGTAGDIPIAGDWDGNGTETIGVYRPSTRTFYLRNANSTGGSNGQFTFGNPGDVPITGDWNGDGYDTIGVYRPANGYFYLKNANSSGGAANLTVHYGSPGDRPISGRWR